MIVGFFFSKDDSMSTFELFRKGGFIMYPLLVFSILAWSVGVYKWVQIRAFLKDLNRMGPDALNSKETLHPHIMKTFEAIRSSSTKELLNERVGRKQAESIADLKEWLWVLGTIASSAPFVGLFGTVVGIMDAFEAIGASGKTGFSVVAAGISESLIATAAGIIVAVVALLFYNFLISRVNKGSQEFRIRGEDLIDRMTSQGGVYGNNK